MECTYSAVSTLPNGITLNPTTGEISGTPTQVLSEQRFTIQQSNSCSNNTDFIQLTVLGIPSISYSSSYTLALNEPVDIQPTAANVDSFFIVSGSLPSGLSFNSQTGAITGSPTSLVTSSTIKFRASNELRSADATVVFRVIRRIFQFSYEASSHVIALQSSISLSPQITGSCSDYSITSGSLPSGLTLNTQTGVISGAPSQSVNNRQVTIKAQNALGSKTTTLTFTIIAHITSFTYSQSIYTIPKSNSFSITPSVTGDVDSYSISSGSLPSGLQLNSNTGVVSGTPTQSVTNRQVTFREQNAIGSKTTTVTFTVLQSITSFSYPQSQYILPKGVSVSLTPSVVGESVTYTVTSGSLPSGLTLNAATGVISGTPSSFVASFQTITVTATNAVGSKACSLQMMVLTKPAALSYPKTECILAVNEPISFVPTVTGDLLTFSLQGSLPNDLKLNNSTGVISGKPTTHTERKAVTVVASNAVGSVSCSLAMRALTRVSGFAYPQEMYSLVNGKSYSLVPSFVGDEVTFSINGTLPEGLTLNSSTGVIEGEPVDVYAQSTVIVLATNDISSASVTLQVTILPLSLTTLILILVVVLLLIIVFILLCYSSHKKRKLLVQSIEELKNKLPEPVKAEAPVVVVASSQPTNLQPVTMVPQPVIINAGASSQSLQPNTIASGGFYQSMQPVVMAQGSTAQRMQPVVMAQGSTTQSMQPVVMAQGSTAQRMQPVTMAQGSTTQSMQPVVMA